MAILQSKNAIKNQLSHNQFLMVMVMLTVIVWVVGLIVSRAMIKTISFNNKLIGKKQEIEQTLDGNLATVDSLRAGYQELETLGPRPQIILQALPTSLDIPALVSKLETLMKASGMGFSAFTLEDSTGTTQTPAADPNGAITTTTGQQEYLYSVGAEGSYASAIKMIKNFELEISPTRIIDIQIQGTQDKASVILKVKAYYQTALTTNYPKEAFK